MAHLIITHIVCDGGLPQGGGKKQVSPICSNPEDDFREGICYLGYNGFRSLKIVDIEDQNNVYRLPEHPIVKEYCYVWIDADRKVYYSPDLPPSEYELIGVATECVN